MVCAEDTALSFGVTIPGWNGDGRRRGVGLGRRRLSRNWTEYRE
jgi:hypothetical protein